MLAPRRSKEIATHCRERHSPGSRCHSGEIPSVSQYDGEMLSEREAPRLSEEEEEEEKGGGGGGDLNIKLTVTKN